MDGGEYITYIEHVYLKKCGKSGDGSEIKADWQSKKLLYRKMTKTTVYEFMNYSMHDESHSINILESIEMILGKKRVNKLSRSDLWLILNVAYAHDIGMVQEYKELEALWSNQEFQKYIEETKDSLDKDDANAAKLYKLLDRLLKQATGLEDEPFEEYSEYAFEAYDAWPLEFRKDITLLMSNFIRGQHGELSKKFFVNLEKTDNYIVCERLYELIGRIAACHTSGQESVEQLPRRCKGFGTDKMHPRFVAMLLRLGDLLDLDNNRFDIFSMKHFGPLPDISVANYKKHKSVKHFHIDPKVIEVTAKSDSFQVCKLNQVWFQYLRSDIEYLISRWSLVAPKKLKGCLMGLPKLEVLHGVYQFKEDFNKGFVLEKKNLLKLFTGNNLYESELDFIREYIQNAFDASKIQLFYEICQLERKGDKERIYIDSKKDINDLSPKREAYLLNKEIDFRKIKPFELTKTAYEAFTIVIALFPDPQDSEKFIMQIIDRGIGIDKEGLEAIVNVGGGWRKRDNHKKVLGQMREWLRPTGGFGIGLQSAFLMTDEVVLYTTPPFEEGYRITLSKYSNDKNVFIEINHDSLQPQGTTAEFHIRFDLLDKRDIISKYLKGDNEDKDLFSLSGKMKVVHEIIKNYIEDTFPCALFPIKIITDYGYECPGIETDIMESFYVYIKNADNKFEMPAYTKLMDAISGTINFDNDINIKLLSDFCKVIGKNDTLYSKDLYLNINNTELRIWDNEAQIFYFFSYPLSYQKNDEVKIFANYKNVLVKDNTGRAKIMETKHAEFVNTVYDVMGLTVEDCLVVSRNGFRNEKAVMERICLDLFTKAYAHSLLLMEKNGKRIPGRLLFYSYLIEESFVEDDTVLQGICDRITDWSKAQTFNCWEIVASRTAPLKTREYSLEGLINGTDEAIWMAEIGNSEEDFGNRELKFTLEFDIETNSKQVILEKCDTRQKFSLKNFPAQNDENNLPTVFKVIQDKKIHAILTKYKKAEGGMIVDFCPNGTKQPMKAYSIKRMDGLLQEEGSNNQEETQSNINTIDEDGAVRFDRTYKKINLGDKDILLPLVIDRIPFEKRNLERHSELYYIISPYTHNIGMQMDRPYPNTAHVTVGQLIEMVEKEPSYKNLCQWVYCYQREKKSIP